MFRRILHVNQNFNTYQMNYRGSFALKKQKQKQKETKRNLTYYSSCQPWKAKNRGKIQNQYLKKKQTNKQTNKQEQNWISYSIYSNNILFVQRETEKKNGYSRGKPPL